MQLLEGTAEELAARMTVTLLLEAYGQALGAWADINRFALYEALHLKPVADSRAERSQNTELALMVGEPE